MPERRDTEGRVLLIVNPASGRRRHRLTERVKDVLDDGPRRVELLETASAGDARRVAADAPDDIARIVAVGGDGTLNEVLDGLAGRDIPVAVIPTGTANILARAMRIPLGIVGSAHLARDGRWRRMDVGRTDRGSFVAVASAGFDAAVVHAFAATRQSNIAMRDYVAPVLNMFLRYGFPKVSVTCDGRKITDRATTVIVGNTPVYGAPCTPTPNASPYDGLLDVAVFTSSTLPGFLTQIAAATFGWHDALPGVYMLRARRVECTSAANVPVQKDGDPAGRLPVTFEIAPGALRLVAPGGTGEL